MKAELSLTNRLALSLLARKFSKSHPLARAAYFSLSPSSLRRLLLMIYPQQADPGRPRIRLLTPERVPSQPP